MNMARIEGLSELQLNAILGSLMGDAALHPSGQTTKALRWNHGVKQMDYVQHKYRTLSEFATRPPLTKPNPGYGDTWAVLTLRSLSTFHYMYLLTHPNGVTQKTITPEFLECITHPIALAWWYMDDGSRTAGHNTGNIATNGFSYAENELLVSWLHDEWGLDMSVNRVTHSSTGKEACALYIPSSTFPTMMNLIDPYVPDSMKYKTEIMFRMCDCCGEPFVMQGDAQYCSEECRQKDRQEKNRAYYEENKEHLAEKSAAWKAAHRDQINAAARARYAEITPEQKQRLNEYCQQWRTQNREHYLAVRKAWRDSVKDTTEYKEQRRAECARYYKRVKQDPERYQRMLEMSRERRHTDEVRAKEREYLRKHRAEKRAQNPEELARYNARKEHMEMLASMTPEERKAYSSQRNKERYAARVARMSPETMAKIKEERHARYIKQKALQQKQPAVRHTATDVPSLEDKRHACLQLVMKLDSLRKQNQTDEIIHQIHMLEQELNSLSLSISQELSTSESSPCMTSK